ncbi:HNH endonuclease [Aliarcobacter butzleri]|uniref:HNH endonuclease n=1 Tax=Aliarcobacter butzleri TaxID=28197 RepID=UPI00263EC952|nr:HNH endonuclease [Aliarcobacter butzleri]MDN5100271.1 HNH endonuclease [Aliarcobacter butzleri]
MIKLERADKPSFLTDEKVQELTDKFKLDGTSVWNIDELKEVLLDSSYGKCAYCESNLTEESKYMEVEHFEDKKNNPEKVILWENLLPSCKKCNGKKSTHDVITEPIINPYEDIPKEHIKLKNYRFSEIDNSPKGKNSIEVLDLNNYERLIFPRFKIGNKLQEITLLAKEKLNNYLENKSVRNKNKIVGVIEEILKECQCNSIYSATTSTILLNDENFNEIMLKMKEESIWDSDIEELYIKTKNLILG